jgi:hypothetical protein
MTILITLNKGNITDDIYLWLILLMTHFTNNSFYFKTVNKIYKMSHLSMLLEKSELVKSL